MAYPQSLSVCMVADIQQCQDPMMVDQETARTPEEEYGW